ncbi:MAG TPA: NUDIX hydrolase [Candidatus Limnocylindrales bacterium]|nr:NUDIX hydrolase [Candidatus Limnocylindrales bacterium]
MKRPAPPVVGSGDPAEGTEWVVESSTSILKREPWLEVFEEHLRLPDGRLVDDFYTIRLRDFVVVAPLTEDGRVIMVRHYRHGPRRITRSLPSGFVEGDETPAEAAKRELLEETGFAAEAWSYLGSYVVDGNRRCGTEHVFLATGARRVAEPTSDDLAEATVQLLTVDEASEALSNGEISELATAAGLAIAFLKRDQTDKSTTGA